MDLGTLGPSHVSARIQSGSFRAFPRDPRQGSSTAFAFAQITVFHVKRLPTRTMAPRQAVLNCLVADDTETRGNSRIGSA
ncbi:MAG: hypothetical protein C0516_13390 [Gemmatimonas sp.]|nr:hypothetical protein [Gemmatimonas sp.]